ncbi:GDP-mannose 4,6-dehydratase [Candidatus Chloroploca sp. M-50]|uniref:GDP-mannose 4,6-dehydratase n=1 Tax=Candidatus Chloroploca mongolica TaxID=2528176 RepID=A0ABS4DGZ1_9CHLR|nr:GDP-mannose 4,6-dehydratase [Candidatus Chloroploca mongolica]MBP1468709.1 GDP-mannose 4,6-dehydratase [Candidatus Chloroploca mongolica]
MNVLITGINGFVGSYLAEYLLAQGKAQIWGVTRAPGRLPPFLAGQVHEIHADLTDAAATLRAVEQAEPAVIYHLAGQPFVPESFRDPAATLQTNTLGALHIFLALIALRSSSRVLVVGTNEEYGLITQADLPLTEQTPLRPTNPYGVSKASQGLLAYQYHLSHSLDTIRLRPFTHIGPRQNERFVTAAFARQIARIERGLQPATLQVGNLSARRDFTDVRDVVRAYALAAENGEAGAVYNVASGQAVMIRALLDMLLEASGIEIEVCQNPELMRPIDIPLVVGDASRLHEATGWQPQIPLRQTLGDILDFWRAQVVASL